MRSLVKTRTLRIRLTGQDARQLERLAKLETRRRGELVGESTLLREIAMPRIRELLAAAGRAAA